MYSSIKSCVQVNGELSNYFFSHVGVRQGENLSPFLFTMYLNDLETFLEEHSASGTDFLIKTLQEKFHSYFKLFFLLYADDTVLLSDTPSGLQRSLDVYSEYCRQWKLEVNTNKTKVLIFSKKKTNNLFSFAFNGNNLDIVDSFSYLGVLFNYNNSFSNTKKMLVSNAKKAMYALLCKIDYLHLPIDIQLELFDSLVVSVLTYSSEIWGFENINLIENVHLDFCKRILRLRKNTPNYMVYGELGRFPLYIQISQRMYNFWCNIVHPKTEKLSVYFYRVLYQLFENGEIKSPWLKHIKTMLDKT